MTRTTTRFLLTAGFILLSVFPAQARERYFGFCALQASGVHVSNCTITVFDHGTTDLSTLFDDNSGTVRANPFTTDSNGFFFFYADDARYDIRFAKPGEIPTPFTLADALLDDIEQRVTTIASVASGATPTFDVGNASIITFTLNQNVTSSTITNGVTGQILTLYLAQDGTGGWTFAWPANVQLRKGGYVVDATASAVSVVTLYFDGTNWREIARDADREDLVARNLNLSGTFNSNLIPDATGRDLCSSGARCDAFIRDFDVNGTVTGLQAASIDDGGAASTSALFSGGAGAASFRNIVDADVPNTITLDNLTQVTTRNHSALQGIAATDHHAQRVQIWRGGFYEASPSTGLTTIPLPVSDQCAAGISVERVSVAAITKGSGTMTFQVTRYNSAGASQGNIFSGNQTYSNTGDNRQDYNVTTSTATANDYFRFNIVTLNGQADVTFIVEGKCDVL